MASFRLALALVVTAVTSPAWAEDHTPVADLPQALRVPTSVLAQVGADRDQGPPREVATPKRQRAGCNRDGCGYKALLRDLPLARDIQATEKVSVRLIPTGASLGGEANTPILLHARVDGQYGLHLRARF